MALPIEKRILAWVILIVCVAAVPVSLFVRQGRDAQKEVEERANSLRVLLPRQDRILVVRLYDMIMDDDPDSLLSPRGSAGDAKKQLRKAVEDKHVKAVLFRINSPGGTVAASQELNGLVQAIRDKGKPIFVSMGDIAASGGYYVAAAADRILAEPGTLTGSIGVIVNLLNLEGIERKLGIEPQVVKSGKFKDMGSPNKPLSAEERDILQSLINDSYSQFVQAIANGRGMKEDKVRRLADGRVYSGNQALALGLVDELGGYDQALAGLQKAARQKYGLKRDLPVDDKRVFGILGQLFEGVAMPFRGGASLDTLLPPSLNARFLKQPLWIYQ